MQSTWPRPNRGQYPGHVITLDQSVAVKLQGAGKMSTFTIFRLLCNIWLYFLSYPPNEMTHQNLFKVQSMCPAQVLPPECGRRSMSCIDHTLNECDSKIYEQLILQVGSVILITVLLLGLKGCFVIWWLLSLSLWACLLINDVFQKLCVQRMDGPGTRQPLNSTPSIEAASLRYRVIDTFI